MKASESRKTDRIIVIASAAVGLGLATWAIVQANGFSRQFPAVPSGVADRGADLLEAAKAEVASTVQAAGAIANPSPATWDTAAAAGRQRGFLVSTGLVFRRGADEASDAIIDLDKPEPRLRDAFPNDYWQKFPGLPLEVANVAELDPDQDYFTNLQEFQFSEQLGKEFNPTDPKSHPPLHFLLRFVKFEETAYKLRFSTANAPDFSLRHENDDREKRWSDTASLNEDANGNKQLDEGEDKNFNGTLDAAVAAGKNEDAGRFEVLSYKEIEVDTDGFKEKKVEITVQDNSRPPVHPLRTFTMVEGQTLELPTKMATFDYLPRPGVPLIKREFEKFALPETQAPSYFLKSLDADKAVLEFEEGGEKKSITMPRGQLPVP